MRLIRASERSTWAAPDVLTQNEIAELALTAWGKKPRIVHLPDWIRRLTLWTMRTFTTVKTYGPVEFFLTATATDSVAPCRGVRKLADFFQDRVRSLECGVNASLW